MWESPETLTHVKNVVQIASIVLAFLAALAGAFGHVIGNRISELNAVEATLLKERVATADGRATFAVAETTTLKARLAPRVLTDDQRNELVRRLETVPVGPVVLWVISNDPEAHDFAEAISSAIGAAKWPSPKVESALFESPPTGIVLGIHSQEQAPLHASALQKALIAIGFEAPAGTNTEISPDTVRILVGRKP
jgi:hypothetical protein